MNHVFKNLPVLPFLWTSKFDYIKWKFDDKIDIGKGSFEKITIEISLLNIKIDNYHGLKLSFISSYDIEDYSIDMIKSSKIVGIVTNAIKERINDHYWDFIYCKDSWFFRQIMNRIYREKCLIYTNTNSIHLIQRADFKLNVSSIENISNEKI